MQPNAVTPAPSELYIGGEWIIGMGELMSSAAPCYQRTIWQGRAATKEQITDAVQMARQAFTHWRLTNFDERVAIARQFNQLLADNKAAISHALAEESGKPLWEALTEIAAMQGKLDISVTAYHERTGSHQTTTALGASKLTHKPHGVVAVFGPYNFPGHLPNGHIIPALLAGNTIVFKPSELTPRFGAIMTQLWAQAGLPKGVLNLVQGGSDVGKALAIQPQLDGLFFTGSSDTGTLIHQHFSGHPSKILALEMGGNNPLIVGSVDNPDAVSYAIIQSAFLSAGQRCTCARRLLLPKSDANRILQSLTQMSKRLSIGTFDSQPAPFMSSLINPESAKRMLKHQATLLELGATPIIEMKELAPSRVSPAIIDVTDIRAQLEDKEYFGPLLKVITYDSFDQALEIANDTQYGLSAGLLSDDPSQIAHFEQDIRAGIVNVNRPTTGASSAAPFGGIGNSGNHRASAYYAADYCAYPVASMTAETCILPDNLSPGIRLEN